MRCGPRSGSGRSSFSSAQWQGRSHVTVLPFVYRDLLVGNIHLMLGAAIVLGFRYPAAWAFPILTKVTPGVGILWFAVRREWRPLFMAVAVTAAVAADLIGAHTRSVARLAGTACVADSSRAGDPYLRHPRPAHGDRRS